MFENLKNVIYSPIIDSVKKEYTGRILPHLIVTELIALSPQTEYK